MPLFSVRILPVICSYFDDTLTNVFTRRLAVADISGFTAWSSIRDPHQVFKLLESVFQAFDVIAKRYRVFKVETVGDCYVGR